MGVLEDQPQVDPYQELLHLAVELELQDQVGLLVSVMEAAALTTCQSLVPRPPSVLVLVTLDCTPLLLLILPSLLEAQGPPNTCPPSSLLLLCPHHKVSLTHGNRRASPTT